MLGAKQAKQGQACAGAATDISDRGERRREERADLELHSPPGRAGRRSIRRILSCRERYSLPSFPCLREAERGGARGMRVSSPDLTALCRHELGGAGRGADAKMPAGERSLSNGHKSNDRVDSYRWLTTSQSSWCGSSWAAARPQSALLSPSHPACLRRRWRRRRRRFSHCHSARRRTTGETTNREGAEGSGERHRVGCGHTRDEDTIAAGPVVSGVAVVRAAGAGVPAGVGVVGAEDAGAGREPAWKTGEAPDGCTGIEGAAGRIA